MIHTQESWDMVQEGLISDYEGLDILYSTAFPRPVQIMRQSIPHNGQTLYAGYADRRFGDRWFGPAKSGRDREDTLIPIRVYTNPIGRYT